MTTEVMAKQPKPVPSVEVENPTGVTTWKCYQPVAKTLRLIGAHLGLNQEEVLNLFAEDFENYLISVEDAEKAVREKRRKKPT